MGKSQRLPRFRRHIKIRGEATVFDPVAAGVDSTVNMNGGIAAE